MKSKVSIAIYISYLKGNLILKYLVPFPSDVQFFFPVVDSFQWKFEVKSVEKGKSKTASVPKKSHNQRQIPYMPYISLPLYRELPALTGAPV
jgi:hypothetical protein